jgi:hypothetical protein
LNIARRRLANVRSAANSAKTSNSATKPLDVMTFLDMVFSFHDGGQLA